MTAEITEYARDGKRTIRVGDRVRVGAFTRWLPNPDGTRREWDQRGWSGATVSGFLQGRPERGMLAYVSPGPGGACGRWTVPADALTKMNG